MYAQAIFFITAYLLKSVVCGANHAHHEPTLPTSRSHLDEKHHIRHHMNELTGEDVNQMAENELQFMYFKMHDSDDNDKLDGCELVKSLLHWHIEEANSMVPDHTIEGTTRIFEHDELSAMIDPILLSDDKNWDGFIDYSEFVTAQKSRGL